MSDALQKTTSTARLYGQLIKYKKMRRLQVVKFSMASVIFGLCAYVLFYARTFIAQHIGTKQGMYHILSAEIFVGALAILAALFVLQYVVKYYHRCHRSHQALSKTQKAYEQHIAQLEGGELSFALLDDQSGELTEVTDHG